jgi:formate hydrogenlyase subunit 4
MSAAIALVVQLLHVVVLLAAAPLLAGLTARLRVRLLGRAGPPIVQPWRDLLRLSRKQPVLAGTGWLFTAAPAVAFAATLAAAALVPSFATGMTTAPLADLLVIAGLLAAGRGVLALAAMDTGTAIGGIGASRAAAFSVFSEAALLMAAFALALLAGTSNLDLIVGLLREGVLGFRVSLGLAVLAIGLVALADGGRRPVGGAVRDALEQQYSGRHLALLEWGAALRLLLWLTLIADLALPFGIAEATGAPLWWLVGLAGWAAKIAVLAVALAVFEVAAPKPRVVRVPEALGMALLLALLAVLALFAGQGVS